MPDSLSRTTPDSRSPITDHRSETSPDVSVIIVTYNSENQIAACLESTLREGKNIEQEIIVVDNNSTDGTVKLIEKDFPEVTLINPGENWGFAKACNYAAVHSKADHILLLNPDTIVTDQAVEKILQFAKKNQHFGFYGGRTLKEDGVTLERSSCWGTPTLWSIFCFASGLSSLFRHNPIFDPESLGSWERDTIREVGVITGCFLLANKKAWKELTGFDEHYWLYGEDVDLSIRARKAGFRPVIYPEAIVIHEIGQSSTSETKFISLYRGKVSLIKRHWSFPKRSLAILLTKIGVLLRSFKGSQAAIWKHGWKERRSWEKGHNN